MNAAPRIKAGPAPHHGLCLVECLVYIGVLAVIIAVAGAAYARVLDHVRHTRRVAADISRALDAGERWRADVRRLTAPPRLVEEGSLQALHLPAGTNEIVYFFDGSNVVRRVNATPDWAAFLPRVKASRFLPDPRQHVSAWRWEIELQPGPRHGHLAPLFSFTAVPSLGVRP